MMIEPAVTTCPPYALTPRYCALLSRPLRVLPCPFLCAISHLFAIRYVSTDDCRPVIAQQKHGRIAGRVAGMYWDFGAIAIAGQHHLGSFIHLGSLSAALPRAASPAAV